MKIAGSYYSTMQTYSRRDYSGIQNVQVKPVHAFTNNFQMPFYGLVKPNAADEITQEMFEAAKRYLYYGTKKINFFPKLKDFDLGKLNGIQKGIEVFKGMTMKEIAYICDNLDCIMVYRGCNNGCGHCMVDAIPQRHFNENSDTISEMPWENFLSLIQGIETLSDRLGFRAVSRDIDLFRDADCIDLEMKDENGRIHDFLDANWLLHEITGSSSLFDTASWSPKNKKHQQRAENFVRSFANPMNEDMVQNINISINPFHRLNMKSIEYEKAGDIKKAKEYRELYIERMANALFTFTPIINDRRFQILSRIMPDNYDLYNKNAIDLLNTKILDKLEQMYKNDYSSEKKYIQDESLIGKNIEIIKNKMNKDLIVIGNMGRANKLFSGNIDLSKFTDLTNEEKFINEIKTDFPSIVIDANGDVYATNSYLLIPTKIKLNFNTVKNTVLPSKIIDRIIITREMINQKYPSAVAA